MVVGGKFALLRRLGEGGVGVVFEAEDTWIGRRVALKVLHTHLAQHADILARFRREARAAAMTHHPNIVGVFEVGQWRDGSPYIVQELLVGQTLADLKQDRGQLKPVEAAEILVPIMGALEAAHRAGIVHRDIKPENIFLARTPEGEMMPKLIDFGIAKMASGDLTTLTGALLGTPAYMAPEQVSGATSADARTDVWAMGAVLYELLSGGPPYDGPTAAAMLGKILTEPVTPLTRWVKDVPPALADIVHRALSRDPGQRYQTMEAMLDAVLAFAREPDPSLAARHARSLPPPSVTQPGHDGAASGPKPPAPAEPSAALAPEGFVETLPEGAAAADASRRAPEWARPMLQPELGWYEERTSPRAPRDLDWYVAAAGQALRDNALEEAVAHAEQAIVACGAAGEKFGQMRLLQATALRWLGHYADAERCAVGALGELRRASPAWYGALGHLALIAGYLGKNEHFAPILGELSALEAAGPVPAPHVIAASRLAISLIRAGDVERAKDTLSRARARAEANTEDEPMVRAWIYVTIAELAMHEGDPAGYLAHLEHAVAFFAEAGDARNACLQRANIGNGYLQLGAYARAKSLLREAIAVGEPMKLGFIAPVRANLGFLLARLGDVQLAFEIESAALDQCVRERYRRFELAARIYLAAILALRDEPARAEAELRAAISASESSPPIRAYALAHLADLLLSQERADEARADAEEAMRILRALLGVEEGESLIRLTHALTLERTGDARGAEAAIGEARRRLLERADRINDARLRRSFLDHIPENARTLAMAARYKQR
jgi:tetratricopeptide (TPR) repeat protein/tRNA A-37 threonylcarbamoyl transferase component Bud32